MLNTDSKLVSTIIWLAVAAIVADGAWTLFRWPAPDAVLRTVLNSGLAALVHRNQVIFAALLGFGGMALAYGLNAWRERAERRHILERAERRDGSVLAQEAREIATLCESAAQRLETESASASLATVQKQLAHALAPNAHMLLAASPEALARLGAGASSAARSVRLDVQRLRAATETPARDGDGGNPAGAARTVASLAAQTAASARLSCQVFDALAKVGPAAADRAHARQAADTADRMRPSLHHASDSPPSPRLLPAA